MGDSVSVEKFKQITCRKCADFLMVYFFLILGEIDLGRMGFERLETQDPLLEINVV